MDRFDIRYSRATWASLYTLLVVWAVGWIARAFFTEVNESQQDGGTSSNEGLPQMRLDRFIRVLRDAALAILITLVLNSVMAGIFTRSVLVLAWIFTALALVWAVGEVVMEKPHGIARAIAKVIIAGIAIAIGALGFAHSPL
ncbi:hypothetical protein BJV82DRAFT_604608 [Fennellomyces sp. T-0311]|nr:hypothetical protein BJV82DRAFT_604608 [Fennellomyces sp. T-0311]